MIRLTLLFDWPKELKKLIKIGILEEINGILESHLDSDAEHIFS